MRKLTKREKISLSVLLAIIFFYAYFQYIVIPQSQNMKKVKAELLKTEAEVAKVKSYRERISQIENELEKQNIELKDLLKSNFIDLKQEDVIFVIESLADESGITNEGVVFEKPVAEKIKKNELNLNSLELKFTASYDALSEFLDKISLYEKRIIVDKIKVDRNKDNLLSGTVLLKMYSLEENSGKLNAIFDWSDSAVRYSINPFDPFAGYLDSLSEETNAEKKTGELSQSQIKPETYGTSAPFKIEDERLKNKAASNSLSSSLTVSSKEKSLEKSEREKKANADSEELDLQIEEKAKSMEKVNANPGSAPIPAEKVPAIIPPVVIPPVLNPPLSKPSPLPEKPKPPAVSAENNEWLIEEFNEKEKLFVVENPRRDISVTMENENGCLHIIYNLLKQRNYSSISIGFREEKRVEQKHFKFALDVKPLIENSHSLKIVLRDSKERRYDAALAENLNWTDWKTLTLEVPQEAELPIVIERVYVESRNNSDDLLGELLLRDLKVID